MSGCRTMFHGGLPSSSLYFLQIQSWMPEGPCKLLGCSAWVICSCCCFDGL